MLRLKEKGLKREAKEAAKLKEREAMKEEVEQEQERPLARVWRGGLWPAWSGLSARDRSDRGDTDCPLKLS